MIQKEKDRQTRMNQEVADAEAKFVEEHKDEIDAVQKWEQDQQTSGAGGDEYGDEDDEETAKAGGEDPDKPKEKPPMPEFNKEEFL